MTGNMTRRPCAARILNRLLRGDFYSVCAERWKTENSVRTIARILGNTVAVYLHLYEPFLKSGERIRWWRDVKAVNMDSTFRQLSEEILKYATSSDLRGANLQDADLRGANLPVAYLSNANLQGADLRKADLQDANL